MIFNRRKFKRFEIITVLEFKLLKDHAGTFFGITRNFSCEGFCLETQCPAAEPGDALDISIRHPHRDLTVSVPGVVIWKRNADKFAYVLGINLKETDLDTRFRMFEIMSSAGDVPVDSFVSEGDDSGRHLTGPVIEAGTSAEYSEQTEFKDLLPEDTVDPVVSVPEYGSWQEESEPSDENAPPSGESILKMKKTIYTSIAVSVFLLVVFAYLMIYDDSGHVTKSQSPVRADPASRIEENNKDILYTDRYALPQERSTTSEPGSDKMRNDKASGTSQAPPDVETVANNAYVVQIGAWKNPDNAREMLMRINKFYPDAYLTVENKFNKVKIPAPDKTRGDVIKKDVEERFGLKPLVLPGRP